MDETLKLIAAGYAELQPEPVETPVTDNHDPEDDTLPLHLRLVRGFEKLGFKDGRG